MSNNMANNRIEADHSQLKHRLRPMRGLRRDRTASVIIAGHAFTQNIRHGHYELGLDARPPCGSPQRSPNSPKRSESETGSPVQPASDATTQRRPNGQEACWAGLSPLSGGVSSRHPGPPARHALARISADARLGQPCTFDRPVRPPACASTSQRWPSVRMYTSRRPSELRFPFHQWRSILTY
jgi:DDE domain